MNLEEFFIKHQKVALGFSGGVDSSYLLYCAKQCKADVHAYYVQTQFQPKFELEDAKKVAEQIGITFTIINASVLSVEKVMKNPSNRCYYCKKHIFGLVQRRALEDGYTTIIDGTNASDEAGDRPGMQALQEMQVYSPLRLCGITKEEVRRCSREAKLCTWNKPAYACLATRIPTGTPITEGALSCVEDAENILHKMGFIDFRVRMHGDIAVLQVTQRQLSKVVEERQEIEERLGGKFDKVVLDLKTRMESTLLSSRILH